MNTDKNQPLNNKDDTNISLDQEEVLRLYSTGKYYMSDIARTFNVSRQRVSAILKKKLGGLRKSIPKKIRENIVDQCFICGSRQKLSIHHINEQPDDNRVSNLVCLCHDCHAYMHKETGFTFSKNGVLYTHFHHAEFIKMEARRVGVSTKRMIGILIQIYKASTIKTK